MQYIRRVASELQNNELLHAFIIPRIHNTHSQYQIREWV